MGDLAGRQPKAFTAEIVGRVKKPSFTDEDVKRVAEAVAEKELGLGHLPVGLKDHYYSLARAALSAYLEPTTKGDT